MTHLEVSSMEELLTEYRLDKSKRLPVPYIPSDSKMRTFPQLTRCGLVFPEY